MAALPLDAEAWISRNKRLRESNEAILAADEAFSDAAAIIIIIRSSLLLNGRIIYAPEEAQIVFES